MSRKKRVEKWTRERLIKLGIPAVLIPGIILAITLGWNPSKLANVKNYHDIKQVFPESGYIWNTTVIRMINTDAYLRGFG